MVFGSEPGVYVLHAKRDGRLPSDLERLRRFRLKKSAHRPENIRFQQTNIGQVAVQLPVIQAIPHHKLIRQIKAFVLYRNGDQPPPLFVEQGANLEAGRLAGAEIFQQTIQRQTRIDHTGRNGSFVIIQITVISTSGARRNLRHVKDFSLWSK